MAASNDISEEIKLASETEHASFRQMQMIANQEASRFQRDVSDFLERDRLGLVQQQSLILNNNQLLAQAIAHEEERYRVRLHNRICQYNYEISLSNAQVHFCPGTCNWLTERAEYDDWMNAACSSCLWYSAVDGYGKTVMTGYLITYLSATPSDSLIYYFFDATYTESLSYRTFLRAILQQVLSPHEIEPAIQCQLEKLIGIEGRREPNELQLEAFLLDTMSTRKRTFMFIDGIDELSKIDRENVLRSLKWITKKANGVKIFITSALNIDLSPVFDHCQRILPNANTVEEDVMLIINSRFDNDPIHAMKSRFGDDLIQKMKSILLQKSEGMFLWIILQIEDIEEAWFNGIDRSGLLDRLRELPKGIKATYAKRISRFQNESTERLAIVGEILRWVLYATRPLKLQELEDAVSFSSLQRSWETPRIRLSPAQIADRCRNMAIYDSRQNTVRLSHHTVRLFLQSLSTDSALHFNLGPAHSQLIVARKCLAYLNLTDFQRAITKSVDQKSIKPFETPSAFAYRTMPQRARAILLWPLRRPAIQTSFDVRTNLLARLSDFDRRGLFHYPLLDYCRANWHHHFAGLTSYDDEDIQLLERMVVRATLPFNWLPWEPCDEEMDPYPSWNMFHWSMKNGHRILFDAWRKRISDQEAIESWEFLWKMEGTEMMSTASSAGSMAKVQLYIEAPSLLRSSLGPDNTQLAVSLVLGSTAGHLAVVGYLLQTKVDVNAAATVYGKERTALQGAAEGGHLAIIELLLQANADVNAAAVESGGRTALQAAAEGGHLAVVERLLQVGADVNARAAEVEGRTALQAAAAGGHLAVVERLLQMKADVNAYPAYFHGRTALQAAAAGGHLAVVERLLQVGADVNAPAAYYSGRTALQAAAAAGGHLAVVERLLQEGANVNAAAAEVEGRTALQGAAAGGHLAIVELLLQANADVNAAAAESGGRTALQGAAESGHLAVVERLLQANANVKADAAYKRGRTALQGAAEGGHLAVVERLLQEGADVNTAAAEWKGRTAIQAATEGGHPAVTRVLTQHGAR